MGRGATLTVTLRCPDGTDAAAIARLVCEMGYTATAGEVTERLAIMLADDRYLLLVAVDPNGGLVGLINAERRLNIESGISFEITGLVVSAHVRRLGVGTALVAAAERWAVAQRASQLRVRSNIVRAEAHGFYAQCGYVIQKTQHCYAKSMSD